MSSIKVKKGYYAHLWDDCDGHPNNKSITVLGNITDFGSLWDDNGNSWHDRVSRIGAEKITYELKEAANGICSLYNPYRNTFVRSGMQAGTDNSVETFNDDFKYNRRNFPKHAEEEFWFVFIKNKEGYYYIFNAVSGKALMPEGADEPSFGQIKAGTQLTTYEFGGQEKWATFKMTPLGQDYFIISPKTNPKLAITMSAKSPDGALTFETNTKGAGQQFITFNYKKRFTEEVSPPKINKNAPMKEQYSLLEYSGAGESSPHKEISVQVPFYMVRDPEIKDFQTKMEKSPYYTLERQEFVKSMTGNEWKYNRSNSDFGFGNTASTTNTQGSSNEVSVETGFEQSFTVEASGLFVTASATTTFSLSLGFTRNWYSEYSKTVGSSNSMKIKPCSKGKLYALANKITLKRQDGSIAKSFVIYKQGSEQFTSVPLNPDECLDLGKKEYEDAKFRYDRYVRLTNKDKAPKPDLTQKPTPTPTPTPKPTPKPEITPPTPTSTTPTLMLPVASVIPDINGCYYIESKANKGHVWDVEGHSRENGGKVLVWKNNKGANQQFEILASDNNYYYFKNVGSDKVADWAYTDEMLQWDKNGGLHQQFKFVDAGYGYYYLEIRKTPGHVIGVSASNKLVISPKSDQAAQMFKFVACDNKEVTASSDSPTSKPTPTPPTIEKPSIPEVKGITDFAGFRRFQNHWKQTEYIHNENGQAECGEIQMKWYSARWTIEPIADMPDAVRIRNVWKKDEYLHIENGKLESGTIEPHWYSARWTLEPVDWNPKLIRIRNFWKKDQFIHIENGKIECSPAEAAWYSAIWNIDAMDVLNPAPTAAPITQPDIAIPPSNATTPSKIEIKGASSISFPDFNGIYVKTGKEFHDCNCWNREDGKFSLAGVGDSWEVLIGKDCPNDSSGAVPIGKRTGCDPSEIPHVVK